MLIIPQSEDVTKPKQFTQQRSSHHPSTVPQFLHILSRPPTHHNITRTAVQRHAQIPDLAILSKQVLQVLLRRLLVEARDDDDPSLDGCTSVSAAPFVRGRTAGSPGGGVLAVETGYRVKMRAR